MYVYYTLCKVIQAKFIAVTYLQLRELTSGDNYKKEFK